MAAGAEKSAERMGLRVRMEMQKLKIREAAALQNVRTRGKERKLARIVIRIQTLQEKIRLYQKAAEALPQDCPKRQSWLLLKEQAAYRADRLQRVHDMKRMAESAEKRWAAASIWRHTALEWCKKLFRTPTPYSREGATLSHAGRTLINRGRIFLGGTKTLYLFEDCSETSPTGTPQQYLFKEATNSLGIPRPERALVTEAAFRLQRYLRGEKLAIPAWVVYDEKGRAAASLQNWIPTGEKRVDLFAWQLKTGRKPDLDPRTLRDLLQEHTLDWLLCNFDTKGSNFLCQPDGHVISCDKESSLLFLMVRGARRMSFRFRAHPNHTLYNVLFSGFAAEKTALELDANLETIRKAEALGEEAFMRLFGDTLDARYGKTAKKRFRAEKHLRRRYRYLREEYRTFYTRLIQKRLKHLEKDSPEAKKLSSCLKKGRFRFADEREGAGSNFG